MQNIIFYFCTSYHIILKFLLIRDFLQAISDHMFFLLAKKTLFILSESLSLCICQTSVLILISFEFDIISLWSTSVLNIILCLLWLIISELKDISIHCSLTLDLLTVHDKLQSSCQNIELSQNLLAWVMTLCEFCLHRSVKAQMKHMIEKDWVNVFNLHVNFSCHLIKMLISYMIIFVIFLLCDQQLCSIVFISCLWIIQSVLKKILEDKSSVFFRVFAKNCLSQITFLWSQMSLSYS